MTPVQQLHEVIKNGDLAQASALVAADASLLEGGGPSGMAPLMLAVYMRQHPIVQMLIAKGAPVDGFAAAALGDTRKLKIMLANGEANLAEHSADGWTVLHLAGFFGHPETVEMLVGLGANVRDQSANAMANQPLHAAAAGRNKECVSLLLAGGANVNAQQHGGYTALHSAAANGDEEIVRMLLAHEADQSIQSEKGQTPADMAREKGHVNIVELLGVSA